MNFCIENYTELLGTVVVLTREDGIRYRGTYLGVRFGEVRLDQDTVRIERDDTEIDCPRGKCLPLARAFFGVVDMVPA